MKININALNSILYTFFEKEMLEKYANTWRKQGESEINITAKAFSYTLGAKMLLQGNIIDKFPILSSIIDKDNNIDMEVLKNITLEAIKEYKDKNKKIVIPNLQWELDEEDINKIFEISKEYIS